MSVECHHHDTLFTFHDIFFFSLLILLIYISKFNITVLSWHSRLDWPKECTALVLGNISAGTIWPCATRLKERERADLIWSDGWRCAWVNAACSKQKHAHATTHAPNENPSGNRAINWRQQTAALATWGVWPREKMGGAARAPAHDMLRASQQPHRWTRHATVARSRYTWMACSLGTIIPNTPTPIFWFKKKKEKPNDSPPVVLYSHIRPLPRSGTANTFGWGVRSGLHIPRCSFSFLTLFHLLVCFFFLWDGKCGIDANWQTNSHAHPLDTRLYPIAEPGRCRDRQSHRIYLCCWQVRELA